MLRTEPAAVVTAEAPSNIAFIKYWGARDLERVIPYNASVSMTLASCRSICEVRTDPSRDAGEGGDEVWLGSDAVGDPKWQPAPRGFADRALAQVQRLRSWAADEGVDAAALGSVRIATRNTFPAAAGIASSASGFMALTLAVVRAFGFEPSPSEASRLALLAGSGSSTRSAWGGYVEWQEPSGDVAPEAVQLHDREHWQLCDLVAITDSREKKVSSREGHVLASTSPYFAERQKLLPQRLDQVRAALDRKDFEVLGDAIELDGVDMHLIAMSSAPAVFYWRPATLEVLAAVRELRERGVLAYSTMDAGPNVHVICQPQDRQVVAATLAGVAGVQRVIEDETGDGPTVEASAG